MKEIIVAVLAFVVIPLGIIKVKNELKMTAAYDRQADALERIAEAVERDRGVGLIRFGTAISPPISHCGPYSICGR